LTSSSFQDSDGCLDEVMDYYTSSYSILGSILGKNECFERELRYLLFFYKFLLKRSANVDTLKYQAAIYNRFNAKPAEGRSGKERSSPAGTCDLRL
jgi:hypothetical protein